MTRLQHILATYRSSSMTEREKETYFEKLIVTYLRHEATYADLYGDVWRYGDWAKSQGLDAKDTGIDFSAKDYVVNGKPALEWVMERQSVTTDKASGITNDTNLWAMETMGNAKYPLELFLRVITVSLETNRIVAGLPGLGTTPEKAIDDEKYSELRESNQVEK